MTTPSTNATTRYFMRMITDALRDWRDGGSFGENEDAQDILKMISTEISKGWPEDNMWTWEDFCFWLKEFGDD